MDTITEALAHVDPAEDASEPDPRNATHDTAGASSAKTEPIPAIELRAPRPGPAQSPTPAANDPVPTTSAGVTRPRGKRPRVAADALARASARAGLAIRKVAPKEPAAEQAAEVQGAGPRPEPKKERPSRTRPATTRTRAERRSEAATGTGGIGLAGLLDQVMHASLDPDDPHNRDAEFVVTASPLFDFLWTRYFRTEVEGAEHIPANGPFIAVGNHSGGALVSDVLLKLSCWERHFGSQRPPRALVPDAPLEVPILRNLLLKLGALRTSAENARAALAQGGPVLIYPAGDVDGAPRQATPHTIDFLQRTAFIKLAFEHGVPIVPMVNVGADEASVASFASRLLGRFSGIESFLQSRNVSLPLGLPGGTWIFGLLPYLPLPSKIVYKVGKPIWCAGGPARAEDAAAVRRVYRRVTRTMQQMLDELLSRRRLPVIG